MTDGREIPHTTHAHLYATDGHTRSPCQVRGLGHEFDFLPGCRSLERRIGAWLPAVGGCQGTRRRRINDGFLDVAPHDRYVHAFAERRSDRSTDYYRCSSVFYVVVKHKPFISTFANRDL